MNKDKAVITTSFQVRSWVLGRLYILVWMGHNSLNLENITHNIFEETRCNFLMLLRKLSMLRYKENQKMCRADALYNWPRNQYTTKQFQRCHSIHVMYCVCNHFEMTSKTIHWMHPVSNTRFPKSYHVNDVQLGALLKANAPPPPTHTHLSQKFLAPFAQAHGMHSKSACAQANNVSSLEHFLWVPNVLVFCPLWGWKTFVPESETSVPLSLSRISKSQIGLLLKSRPRDVLLLSRISRRHRHQKIKTSPLFRFSKFLHAPCTRQTLVFFSPLGFRLVLLSGNLASI